MGRLGEVFPLWEKFQRNPVLFFCKLFLKKLVCSLFCCITESRIEQTTHFSQISSSSTFRLPKLPAQPSADISLTLVSLSTVTPLFMIFNDAMLLGCFAEVYGQVFFRNGMGGGRLWSNAIFKNYILKNMCQHMSTVECVLGANSRLRWYRGRKHCLDWWQPKPWTIEAGGKYLPTCPPNPPSSSVAMGANCVKWEEGWWTKGLQLYWL